MRGVFLTGAVALGLIMSAQANAGAAAAVRATPTPLPTPAPLTTPLAGKSMPYPAYGTPAPGVSETRPQPGVPQAITLAQAIAIAVAKSPTLAQARAQVETANAQVQQARTAELPNLSGTISTNRSNGPSSGSSGSGTGAGGTGAGGTSTGGSSRSSGGGFTSNSISANLRQLIFDGGRVAAQIRAADENNVAAKDTYRRQLQTLAFNVANAYYNALQAERTVAVDAQIVRQNQVQENLVTAQIRAGTAARSDLATAQFPTAQARVALVRAQGVELNDLAIFANSLGLDANADVAPIDDTPQNGTASLLQTPLLSYDTAMARALALRPDYDASVHQVAAAQQSLHAARLGLFPSISGTAQLADSSTNASGGDFKTSNGIGAAISIPIFDQGLTRAATASAQATLDNANASLDNTRLGVQLSVRQGLSNLVSAQAAVQQSDAELNKAREVLRATQAQYRAGVTTLPLLLNAQVALTQAQTDELTAVYALRQAEQAYLFAIGESDIQPTR